MNKHEKHAKLARPSYGEWGRHEFAIMGTTCDDCKTLAAAIVQSLPAYKIAFADAEHKKGNTVPAKDSVIENGVFTEYEDKISYTQINIPAKPNAFQKRAFLNDCDLVLVNGNHFIASSQIIVIDKRKSLEKKLEKLTDVQMILFKDVPADIPDYLVQHLPHITQLPQFSFTDTEGIRQHIKQYLQKQTSTLNGLVLSGGRSTRMGTDKSNIQYHQVSQREYVFNLLSLYCNETFISCNAEQSKAINDLSKLEDTFLNLGPLSGILSAFQHNPNTAWLTVACDLPFLNEDTINYFIHHRNPSKMATAFWDAEHKFPEPLVTIWEPKAYPVLLQLLSQGYSCPRKALINSDVEMLTAPNAFAFKNVNTTEEYREALSLLRKQA